MHKGVGWSTVLTCLHRNASTGILISRHSARPPADILYGSWVPWPGIARARRADLIAESQRRRSVGRVGRPLARSTWSCRRKCLQRVEWRQKNDSDVAPARRRATLHRSNLTRVTITYMSASPLSYQFCKQLTQYALIIRVSDSGAYHFNPRPGLAGRINSSNYIPSGGPPPLPPFSTT